MALNTPRETEKSLICKTPVSLLQELYAPHGITPKYDLVQIEGAVHEPIFKYRVTIGEYVATGSGQSKKKAKHGAAKTILEILQAAHAPELVTQTSSSLLVTDFSSLDVIPGNPVGELQELCMNRRMQPPIYEVTQEVGQPHDRHFIIICVVGVVHRETGSGKSKKVAKRQAAYRMIKKLKEIPAEKEDMLRVIDDDELAQGIVQRDITLKEISWSTNNAFKLYRNLRPIIGSKLMMIQLNYTESSFRENSVEILKDISLEQEFHLIYIPIEEKAKNGLYHCLLQLSTTPEAVVFGVDETESKAKKNAAYNALEYLRIITK